MEINALLPQLRSALARRQSEMVALLSELVQRESPSTDPAALEELARYLAQQWRQRGARVRLIRARGHGPILRAEVKLGRGQPQDQLLALGHFDTVYPLGTLQRMPFRVRQGRAYGPGTFDMKAGIVQALFAVDVLHTLSELPARRVVFLFTSDEEVGSRIGRPVLEREARRSRAVLVLEPAGGPGGALKTGRKGVGEFELIVEGRAAHAGLEPEKGVNAVEELARQIVRVKTLERPARGLTVNVDVIEGGSRTNVIPDHARAVVDVRVPKLQDGPRMEKQMQGLKPVDRRARLTVQGGVDRPPLERTPDGVRLFRQAQRVGQALGLRLEEVTVGGGSDGNFTAALGVPTLDGLGGVGAGAHSPGEYVVVDKLPERAALLAGLLLTL